MERVLDLNPIDFAARFLAFAWSLSSTERVMFINTVYVRTYTVSCYIYVTVPLFWLCFSMA